MTAPLKEFNRLDASGKYVFHYSLTQRVFLLFQRMGRPLDRRDVMSLLNIGADGLKHAMTRLAKDHLRPVPGQHGFYEIVPGAGLPLDTRGTNPRSHGNRGRRVQLCGRAE